MFTGFSPTAADFLWQLRFNNNKDWFNAHKADFQQQLQLPFKELATQTQEELRRRHPELHLNLHISRIYRDARRLFGRGPMKDHLWFSLFCAADNQGEVPTFFFGFHPEGYDYGIGYPDWAPALMQKYRAGILQNPAPMTELARQFAAQDRFVIEGETYARSKGDVGPLLQPWFDRKWISLIHRAPHPAEGEPASLAQDLLSAFEALLPYYRYWLWLAQRAE